MSRQGYTRPYGSDASDPVRLVAHVAAILSVGAGVIHVSAAGDHTSLPVMFAGFLVVAMLQVAFGALLLWRQPSRLLLAAGLALMLGAIGVWLISRTAGLPFLDNGHAEPIGFKDGVTVLFEVASIPALLLLLNRDLARVSLPSSQLGSQTLTAVGASCFALMLPALLLGGGEHHTHEQAVEMGIHADGEDHVEGDELAHAGSDSHRRADKGHDPAKDHAKARGDGHRHGDSSSAATDHHAGTGHEHDGAPTPGETPRHHAGGDGRGEHRDGEHRRGRRDRDRGHGDHGGEQQPDDGSGDEPPITVTYEPEPGVCLAPGGTQICLP